VKDILDEIDRLRINRGWTEYELAKRSGLPQSTISGWYRNRQTPTIQSLEKICKGFGITLSQFLDEGDAPISLTAEQREMLGHWSALEDEQKKVILELLKKMGKLPENWKSGTEPNPYPVIKNNG